MPLDAPRGTLFGPKNQHIWPPRRLKLAFFHDLELPLDQVELGCHTAFDHVGLEVSGIEPVNEYASAFQVPGVLPENRHTCPNGMWYIDSRNKTMSNSSLGS